jgi:hypothetical protein
MSFLRHKGSKERLGDILPSLDSVSLHYKPKEELGRVLITSGNGVVGYRVAMSLLEAGYSKVRVGIYSGKEEAWKNEKCATKCAEALQAKGAEVVEFDWTREERTLESSSYGFPLLFDLGIK